MIMNFSSEYTLPLEVLSLLLLGRYHVTLPEKDYNFFRDRSYVFIEGILFCSVSLMKKQ